ncbi:MAG: hypothetical protein FWC43_05080 [Planctomycetaceae bacterium]|nr:hypothetical protein [Planctomycetaceae bacterium]
MLFSRLFFSVVLLFIGGNALVKASDPPVYITDVLVGIDGYYKNGFWTPVTVSWTVDQAVKSLELETVDSDGIPLQYRFDVEPNQHSTTVSIKLGRNTGEIVVRLRSNDVVLAEKRIKPAFSDSTEIRGFSRKRTAVDSDGVQFLSPVPPERPIYLVLAANDAGIQDAVSLMRLKENRRPILVMIDSLEKMPTDRLGLDAVELICLTTSSENFWDGITSDDARIQAMVQWMRLGGHVLFAPGKADATLLSGKTGALVPFLPGRYERMATLRQGKPLELYTESNRAILMDGSEAAPFLELPFLADPEGVVVLAEADLPLLIRKSCGFGTLTWFGADLTGSPLADWRDRGQLVSKLLDSEESRFKGTTASHNLMHPGYHDLSGQIRSALDRFDGIRAIPFSLILVLIVVYILVIGPADWFIVHKVLKRPRLTWITFPLWIVLFCGLAVALGTGNRTRPLMVNSVQLVDLAPCDNLMRVTTWGSVYSPKDARYDIFLDGTYPDAQVDFHWLGLSGSSLGGMEPKTVSLDLWDEPYGYNGQNALKNVPMRVRTTKSFFGQLTDNFEPIQVPYLAGEFRNTSLRQTGGIPVGTLTNDFSCPLENAVLVYGSWALKLGRLESGQSVSVGSGTVRRELRMLLNATQAGFEDDLYSLPGRQVISYDTQSQEIWPILRTMTFFKTFGGFDAVGLHNTLHPNLDWSSVLATNQAILIAQIAWGDDTKNGGQIGVKKSNTDQWMDVPGRRLTVLRVILPVKEK